MSPAARTSASRSGISAAARGLISRARVLLLQLETPLETVGRRPESARKAGVEVILNPAPACALPDRSCGRFRILTPNETEAALLSGRHGRRSGVGGAGRRRALLRRGLRTVIVTIGAKGALLATSEGSRLIPGFKVKAVDTTAAGDVFNGALAVRLAEGRNLVDAVRFAHAAAALSVTGHGAQPSIPTRAKIKSQLRK